MWRHRCAGRLKTKLYLRSGSEFDRNFVGFFNVPVRGPTRGHPFIRLFRETAQFSRLVRHVGVWRTYSHLKPPASPRGSRLKGRPQVVRFELRRNQFKIMRKFHGSIRGEIQKMDYMNYVKRGVDCLLTLALCRSGFDRGHGLRIVLRLFVESHWPI